MNPHSSFQQTCLSQVKTLSISTTTTLPNQSCWQGWCVASLAILMHLKTAPLTNTVLQFSNFNRDFEQIERNENVLPKAKHIIEAP
jgi:hypothetical protein